MGQLVGFIGRQGFKLLQLTQLQRWPRFRELGWVGEDFIVLANLYTVTSASCPYAENRRGDGNQNSYFQRSSVCHFLHVVATPKGTCRYIESTHTLPGLSYNRLLHCCIGQCCGGPDLNTDMKVVMSRHVGAVSLLGNYIIRQHKIGKTEIAGCVTCHKVRYL